MRRFLGLKNYKKEIANLLSYPIACIRFGRTSYSCINNPFLSVDNSYYGPLALIRDELKCGLKYNNVNYNGTFGS